MSTNNKRIIDSFSRAASQYDQWSASQQTIAGQLSEWMPGDVSIRNILDVGCGTGHLTGLMSEKYPGASILGIDFAPGMIGVCRRKFTRQKNIEFKVEDALRFESIGNYQLVGSSCSFQWMGCPENLLTRLKRSTAPGGYLLATFLTEESFGELRSCYREVTGRGLHGPRLHPAGEIEAALSGSGWISLKSEVHEHRFCHASCLDLLKSMKESGAAIGPEDGTSQLNVRETRQLQEKYRSQYPGPGGAIRITWSVIYLLAVRE